MALTPSQRPIWIGQQLDPDSPLYNMAFTFVVEGAVDVDRFRRAWRLVVDSSDSLRTAATAYSGESPLRLLPPGSCELTEVDLSAHPDPLASFRAVAEDRASRALPLDHPLVDAALVKLGDSQFGLYLNQHHLITDAASTALLIRHLAAEYEALALSTDREHPRVEPYYSTVRGLESLATDKMRQDAAGHWERRRSGPDRTTPFYGETSRPSSTRSRRRSLELTEETSRRLREIASETGFAGLTPDISLFTVISSLLIAWLHRVSGKRQLGFDAPVYNRPTAAAKNSIGLFIEMFPFAVDLDEGDTFRTLGQRCLEETQLFLGNALPAASTTTAEAASNVVLNFFSGSFGDFAGFPMRVEWAHPGHGDRIHALRLQVHDFEARGRFTLQFDANEEIFDPELHQRSIEHFESLMQAFLADPDRPIAAVDLLTETERRTTLVDFNDTSQKPMPQKPLVELFGDQVRLSPEQVALRQGQRQLTFAELDQEVENLAARLLERGVAHGDIVAVSLPRSIEAVVGILATLRAGAAYLPIDPSYPQDRVRQILDDSRARLSLGTGSSRQGPAFARAEIDTLQVDLGSQPVECGQPLPNPGLEDLAYMIYTSGSTGRPKGVLIDHAGLTGYLEWASHRYVRGDSLAFPLFTSLAFDLTVTSLFLPLITGGTLIVYEESEGPLDTALFDVLGDNIVDFIKLTPSHLALLKEMDLSDSRIGRMVVGGEDFRTRLAASIQAQFGRDIEIYNEYGPTEAVVGCMLHRFDAAGDRQARIPIGSPADHVQIYVLNESLIPVPEGVPGELCVARVGLSPGYRNLPELTAERFVPNPFPGGATLYRTGDLARFVKPGTLEYLGRLDRQLKVSGYRVEPREIESVLHAHPQIEDCLVTAYSPRSARSQSSIDLDYCQRCGLPSNYPGVDFDLQGVCSICHAYDGIKEEARAYFSDHETLRAIFAASAKQHHAPYDCMMLLSGGKDSTYALCQLVDMGLNVYAFSLDNGYISDQAKANIRRVSETLGVDYELAITPAMNDIFRDSLIRFSNVCNGCFKAIYTLSLNRARELGIPIVVTGLSRGQFFETRLTEGMFRGGGCSPQEVDRAVLEARKVYHRLEDEVSRRLDVEIFDDDHIFEEVQIVDFYRYHDVGLDELLAYLERRVGWTRPTDTGRSTNCLVNDVGIYIHQKERGFHNYALPYSWDVRMGHKTREAAIAELNDEIDPQEVGQMLAEIGYDEDRLVSETRGPELVAYYVAAGEVTSAELRSTLAATLPAQLVPRYLIPVDAMPLTSQGKIDRAALPAPDLIGVEGEEEIAPLNGPAQEQIAAIWRRVLGLGRIGATTSFFDLGGNSLAAMEVTLELRKQFAVDLPLPSLFQHPTVGALAARVEAEIGAKIEPPSTAETGTPTIPRRPDGALIPLSPAQHGIWLLHRVAPESTAYNLNAAYQVDGRLDLEVLQACLDQLTRRHEILLTSIDSVPAGVVQVIDHERRCVVDHLTCADDQILAEARRIARQTFDLEEGPLFRLTLIEGEGDRQLLLLSSHHVILDEWSLGILWRELAEIYVALEEGRLPDLSPLPIQFADYAAWKHQRLEEGLANRQLDFWRQRLTEPVPIAELPTDRPRRANLSDRGGYVSDGIDAQTVSQLRELASSEQASLSMVLLLALKLLIQRHSETDDILIGTPLADRQLPETTGLLGYFLNTVVLRTDLAGNPTVREALQRVRTTMLEVFDHGDVPFDRIVRELQPARPAAVHPYFQTMFVFQRQQDAAQPLTLPGATLEPIPIDAGSAKFDLTLFAHERSDRIDTMIEFRRDLFESSTIESLLHHYRHLLESIAAGVDEPIENLTVLTEEEEATLLRDGQGLELSVEREPLLVGAISIQVAEQPENPAVLTSGGETMTYGGLQDRADTVTRQLSSLGVEPGEIVALYMERSPAAIAGILGILRAGAAYLPIDPDYPAERRQFLLQDARVRKVVTDNEEDADFESMGISTVEVSDSGEGLATGSGGSPTIRPDDLAYVIYTSGSSGLPKGVLVSHGNLRASNAARVDTYPERPARYLLIPSLSFDSSVAGIFWTLSTGGTLVLPTSDEVRDTEALSATIERQQVTHLLCIPSLYRSLLEIGETSRLRSLETVIVAGEVCSAELVVKHRQLLPEVPLFNEYGPTEATVWATVHRCEATDPPGPVSIGRPIANTQIYVLDSQQRLVPPRIPGEIAIGGSSVAQGYLDRPDLTRERFIDLELPGDADARTRVYKTGDLGRWSPDGTLDFLGRRDEQVKLSGFRIELAEIETALRDHPAIGEAAAVMIPGKRPSDPSRLAAYYVPNAKDPDAIPVSELRSSLAGKLPRYMLPTTLMEVGALPHLPNGKLDRQALANRAPEGRETSTTKTVATRFEIQLMRIWLELLDDPSIDRQSNFFEHGGHSLLIPGLIERVRQDFGVELPLGAIFEAPTVAELAAVIEADEGRDTWRSLVRIRSGGSRAPLYVIHGLAGEISYFYNLARYLPRDRPVYGVQAPAKPFAEMVPMASAYLEEIRQAQPHGPYLLVGYCLGGCIAYEMARQLSDAGEQVSTLVLINSVPPSHLLGESAPLASILARRLKRFTSKGPRQMLASITRAEAVKRHLKSGVRGDKESTEETLDDLLERMHPAYQEATISHYRALRDYRPQPYPGDAWLFRGSDLYLGADYAWRQIVQGSLEVESISGHHQYVLKEPNVQGAAEKLTQILASLDG